jgi:hypothetical protein
VPKAISKKKKLILDTKQNRFLHWLITNLTTNKRVGNCFQSHLFSHWNNNPTITGAAPRHTVNPPTTTHGDEHRIQHALHFQLNFFHLQRNQGWWITSSVYIRLVAGYIRVVNYTRIRYHCVNHWSGREEGFIRPLHRTGITWWGVGGALIFGVRVYALG